MEVKAHMICHTHWDREWYFTREQFRTKLIRLIDELIEVIDHVPDYVSFMLDGQTIALEDYLEIKPYKKDKLLNALRSGKIICGPWYILPDELLISGESHIRNYLTGSKVISECPIKMETAYLPDSFGHPTQMPQIVEGLGMDTMIFWRGTSNDVKNTEFYWESPNKISNVLCIHMPHGYGNCGSLDLDMEKTVPRITNLIESLKDKSTTDVILLMNGSDHIIGQKNITEVVKQLKKLCPQYHIELSTMNRYIQDLKKKLPQLDTYSGEFRSSERSMLLGGTLSTRMILKQNNDLVQKMMERYLEPLLSGEKILGGTEDTKGYSDYIWRKILENQPHDSICGCSIDEVHAEMLTRFRCVRELEEMLLSDTAKRISTLMLTDTARNDTQLMLFEPTQDRIPSYIETTILMDRVLVQEVNFTKSTIVDYEDSIVHPEITDSIKISDEFGRNVPYVILEKDKSYDTLYQDHTMPEIYKVNRLKVGLMLPAYDYGYHMLYVEKNTEKFMLLETQKDNSVIENEYYKISVKNGAFEVFDKLNGKIHEGVGKIIDKGDAGDEYTYSWPEEDSVYTLSQEDVTIRKERLGDCGESLILEGVLMLPERLEESRKKRSNKLIKSPIIVKISLHPGINRIDFKTEIDNKAKDHRLQVQFPTGVKTEFSESADVFNITKRDIDIIVPKKWAEFPQTTHPTHGFMNIDNSTYGMSAVTCGLTEFEAVQMPTQTALNITLLRCVGWLSRTDLLTRKGNGGWTIETPDAQCLGKQVFEYSIAYHIGGWRENDIYGVMEKRRLPSLIKQVNVANMLKLDNILHWVSNLPKEIRLSALKVAENGNGIILRIYSISDKQCQVVLQLPKSIQNVSKVNLTEKVLAEIPLKENSISMSVKPSEIVTVKLS